MSKSLCPVLAVVLSLATVFSLATVPGVAADWPTYLNNNSRRGASDETLKTPLRLRWVYTAPAAPQTAWEGPRAEPIEGKVMRHRVDFDDAIQVVVAAGRVYFGSSVDHKVYCADATTGKSLWTFFTDGPIRLAPTIADGKVYVGSDDGHVYCLDAKSGRLVWKIDVAPKDERLLARGSMISRWPVRTGVLVDDGVAYFGAGIFPHETIYLAAAHADTGKIIWRNGAISQQNAGRNGLSPQGYLLCNDTLLFVPSGRSLPIALSKATGKIVHQRSHDWRSNAGGVVGGTRATLADGQIFSGGAYHFLAMQQNSGAAGTAWIPGRQLVIAGDISYIARSGEIVAVHRAEHSKASIERQKLFLQLRKYRSDPVKSAELRKKRAELADVGVRWKAAIANEAALIATGDLVIAGGENQVVALDTKTGQQKWSAQVEGAARGLAIAGGSLLVSTDRGKIYRFATAEEKSAEKPAGDSATHYPKSRPDNPFPKDKLTDVYEAAAEEILRRTNVKAGFCLVVGSEQGRLAYELAKRTTLKIYGIESDARKVAAARAALDAAGLYGPRITIVHGSMSAMPFSNFFADLITSDTVLLTGKLPGESADVGRHLRPLGGKVCFGTPAGAPGASTLNDSTLGDGPEALVKNIFLADHVASIDADKRWATLTRAALPNVGQWSHQYGNVSNTSFSNDHRIRGGLGVLWYGDPGPSNMVNRHAAAAAPLSTGGRMFIQGTDQVMAYDAYNGRFLWEHKNPGAIRTGVFNNNETSNLAANADTLFVAEGETCTALNAATGKIRATYKPPKSPDGIQRDWGYVAFDAGLLFGTATIHTDLARSLRRRGRVVESETDAIFAVDTKTGERIWTYRGKNILHTTIAIGDGRMFFIDSSLSPEERQKLYLKDKPELKGLSPEEAKKIEAMMKKFDLRLAVALDTKTGKTLWTKPVDVTNATHVSAGGGNLTIMYADNRLVLCGANANGHYWGQFLSGKFSRRRLVVLDAATGDKLWAKDANYMNRPLIVGREIIAEPWAFDLHTGVQKTRRHPITDKVVKWQFSRPGHHCGIATATPNMMFFRSGFIGYYDLYNDSGTQHFAGQRMGCWINAIPGNGLLMIPESSAGCVCLFSITSTVVLEPREDRQAWGLYSTQGASTPVKQMAINLGAPGDRRDPSGTIWFGYPRPASRGRLEFLLDIKPQFGDGGGFSQGNAASIHLAESKIPWVSATAARGMTRCELPLLGKDDPETHYTVKLYLTNLRDDKPGDRGFELKLQGTTMAKRLNVVKGAGAGKTVIREFKNVAVRGNLVLEIIPRGSKPPMISGIEVVREE